jgi:hypothetical protein
MISKKEKMGVNPQTIRKNLIGFLRLLSSESEQVAYQKNVPYVNVSVELLGMWFSDLYFPEDPVLSSCFTQSELDAMARFNELYSDKRPALPYLERQPGIRHPAELEEWLRSPLWREVMAEAGRALTAFPQYERESDSNGL